MIMMFSLLLLDASDLSLLTQSSQVGAAAATSSGLSSLKGCNFNGRSLMTSLANSSVTYLARGSMVDERGQSCRGLRKVGRGGFLQSSSSELKIRRRRTSHTMCMAGVGEINSIPNGQNAEPSTVHITSQVAAAAAAATTTETLLAKFWKAKSKLSRISFLSPTLSAGRTQNRPAYATS
jgi:hypothetical protein